MAETEYKYWSGAPDFVNADTKKLLTEMIRYDQANFSERSYNIDRALNSLDNAIVQFILVIQKFYQNKDRWENAVNTRAAIAMANSALNFHLFARHSVLLGYCSETELIYRACFERMTRCVVFQLDNELAEKFWDGKEIHQKEIGICLSHHFDKKTKGVGKIAHERIKDMYGQLSKLSHPNSKILNFRTIKLSEKDKRDFGIDFSYCGEKQEIIKLMSIGEGLTYALFSLLMLEMVARKVIGTWANVLNQKIDKLFLEQIELSILIEETLKK
jgi:hypothetical protein